jgi:hypothetical protein
MNEEVPSFLQYFRDNNGIASQIKSRLSSTIPKYNSLNILLSDAKHGPCHIILKHLHVCKASCRLATLFTALLIVTQTRQMPVATSAVGWLIQADGSEEEYKRRH